MHSKSRERRRRERASKRNATIQLKHKLFISFLFGTASKKSKLINNKTQHYQSDEQVNTNTSASKYNGRVHQQQTRANILNSPVDAEQYANQDQESLYNGSSDSRGPRLVNKQLVLPIITFPHNASKDSNHHLIKPSEYLKSIISSDKRAVIGSKR
jgi:hypothetical protein